MSTFSVGPDVWHYYVGGVQSRVSRWNTLWIASTTPMRMHTWSQGCCWVKSWQKNERHRISSEIRRCKRGKSSRWDKDGKAYNVGRTTPSKEDGRTKWSAKWISEYNLATVVWCCQDTGITGISVQLQVWGFPGLPVLQWNKGRCKAYGYHVL